MWEALTLAETPYLSNYPEEVVLSVILYKLGLLPQVPNAALWREESNTEQGRDPYFILQERRPAQQLSHSRGNAQSKG